MPTQILIAPAAAGKTRALVARVRAAAAELDALPRVVVATALQARAWRWRLAAGGGALGVRVLTFDQLNRECLDAARVACTELSEPVQHRLIRALVADHYAAGAAGSASAAGGFFAPLAGMPGFVQSLQDLFNELKGARVWPEDFARVATLGEGPDSDEPRLRELAALYERYQTRLREEGWADRAGAGWLAVETLERTPAVARDWGLVVADGFDSFTAVQTALLVLLAGRVAELVVALTGSTAGEPREVHARYHKTRLHLEAVLGVAAEPPPAEPAAALPPALAHLEAGLFTGLSDQVPAGEALALAEAPDRPAEVRAALRWLKARLVHDGVQPSEVALLARDIEPYRPALLQAATEFGLPLELAGGLPLLSSALITALLDLLRLAPPADGGAGAPTAGPALRRRLVVEAWRSPYFDWSALPADSAGEPIGIAPGDAAALDAAARWGQVIHGREQWLAALDRLAALEPRDAPRPAGPAAPRAQGDEFLPPGVPAAHDAERLRAVFERFVERLTPPAGARRARDFVAWLERLIGPDPELANGEPDPLALGVVRRARELPGPTGALEIAALQTFKEILRGLVWAEDALPDAAPLSYARFVDDLAGACEVTTLQPPESHHPAGLLVATIGQARGLAFRAVAVLGLAEGEFPAVLREDPFLRDRDRAALNRLAGVRLELPTESAEREFFYESVTRARERLLLSRPRLADNGALWPPSPFWEESKRLVAVTPQRLAGEAPGEPAEAASWAEWLESLAAAGAEQGWEHAGALDPARAQALAAAVAVLAERQSPRGGPHDGDLSALQPELAARFGPNWNWSASGLEDYHSCPHRFFVARLLRLEPRAEPAEGLDDRQLGNLYHRLLEAVYQAVPPESRNDPDALLAQLVAVAGPILDDAPRREGFRATAWWRQTRAEILANLRRTLIALAAESGDYRPVAFEARFANFAVSTGDGGAFRLHGFIDRVDRAPDGRVRIIDYKTAGPSEFSAATLEAGERLQLPLYALAARDALGLGEIADGFYWHVRHAEPSRLRLADYGDDVHGDGPAAAMAAAVEHAWQAVRAIQAGDFVPRPPAGGCPGYCPAAGYCWHYDPGPERAR